MLPAGSRVGDYEIEGDLGEGGMARVYRARHTILETHHAIKILDPELRANPEARQRFLDEARIQAKHLDHPGIVKVSNIVATPEHAALVMELVEGGSLEHQLVALRDRPDEIKRIMIGVLEAVGHAHAAGIVHRDLKPANVLLARRGDTVIPKVTDFGIAKVSATAGRSKKSTHAATRMGTLSYMSPEQIRRARDVTARSDVFSLGAMLYELATGALPFDAENDYDVMEQIVNGRYPPPEERAPGIDPVIAQVIRRALQPDPARRHGSCAEMAAALRGDASTPAQGASPAAATATIAVAAPARSYTALVVVLVVATGAAAAGVGVYLTGRGERAPADAGAAAVAVADAAPDSEPAPTSARDAVPLADSQLDGPVEAPVTLVVFGGFTDPFSRRLATLLGELRPRYPRALRVVFKHGIVAFNREAVLPVARAACAAQQQGRYVDYAELLRGEYPADGRIDDERLVELAAQLGLDGPRFEGDRVGPTCAAQLVRDEELVARLGLDAIPAVIVNGEVILGVQSIDAYVAAVDRALAGSPRPLGMVRFASGLGLLDLVQGHGLRATSAGEVDVHYTIWLWEDDARGRKVESSYDAGKVATFTPAGIIVGMARGLIGMRVGGTRWVLIPPELGFGATRRGAIPAGATLLVELELRAVR